MSIVENKALIRRYYDVINGVVDAELSSFFASNIVWHLPPAHPYGGPFNGLEAVMELLGRGIGLYKEGSIHVHSLVLIAEADDVVAHFQIDASLADGSPYHNEYLFRFTVAGGKISAVWEFLDTYYLHSLGMFDAMRAD